ncbi:MAG: extracellular solute-binding protein, partial [Parvibaculaceae bacterium]
MALSRRTLMKLAGSSAVAAAAPTALLSPARAATAELVIAQSGGQAGEALKIAYAAPFTAKTGVPVRFVGLESALGELKAMLQSGTTDRHVWDVELADVLSQPELFDDLDWDAIAPEPIFPEARQAKAIGRHYYSYVMSWNSKAKPIATWAEFFDTEKFPGRRAMMSYDAYAQLEAALLADGVPADKLYPLDVDRAFTFLEANKHKVAVWWDSGSQAAELVTTGEVDYALIYSGRVAYSKDAGMTYNQGISVLNYLAITKGLDAETKASAMKFFHEMTVPEN